MSRSSRGLPTSRAYWELKAEQMLNRVFSNEAPIDLEIVEHLQAQIWQVHASFDQRAVDRA